MKCEKCGTEVGEDDVRVLKRGDYQDKPLCPKCFNEEKEKKEWV